MADTFLNPVELAEIGSTPSNPPSGYKKIYAKTDGKVYALNAAGEEVELTPALVISAGTNSRNTGNVTFANSNGVTFGMDTNGQITASHNGLTTAAQSNHSHGAIAYSGTNVSASFTSASNGLSIQLSADAGGVQSADTNKAGTGFSTTTNAGSNIAGTLGTNGLNLAVPNYLTTFIQSADTNKAGTLLSSNAVGGVNVGGSINSNGLTLNIPAFITTAAQSNHSHGDIAFSGTNVSASFTSASNGLSIQLSAPAGGTGGGGGVAIAGGTNTQTSGTVNFSNSNGVSFGLNTNGVMTAAGGGAIAAGTQVATQGTVSFANSNGVSFGMSGSSQITAQIAPHTYTLIGNTVGNSTVSGENFVFSGGNNITLSGTSNTIVISAAAGGGGGEAPNRFYVEINQGERLTTVRNMSETILSDRPFFFPFWVDGTGVAVNTIRMFVSGIASSNRSLGLTLNAGLYSLVNATQISLLTSGQLSYSITVGTSSTVWNGPAIMDFTGMNGFTMSQEGRYMLALQVRPVSANATWANMGIYGCDNYPSFSRFLSGNTTGATANTAQLLPWQGAYSTTSVGLPSTVARTQIHGGNSRSAYQPYAIIMGI